MAKARTLDIDTLGNAIRDYAGQFLLQSRWSRRNPKVAIGGRDWVVQNMHNFHFKDEFDYVRKGLEGYLGQDAMNEFKAATKDVFTPRRKDVLEKELAERLAIRPDGTRINGALGSVQIGMRSVIGPDSQPVWRQKDIVLHRGTPRQRLITVNKPLLEPVFAGDPTWRQSINATAMNISAEIAIASLNQLVDHLDSDGSNDPVITIRTGSQPADPDVAATGTLLATLAMTDATAFGSASDDGDGNVSVDAGTIADDTSADATGTAGYARVSSSNDGSTPLDDHIDGECGTSGADFNFNTVSFVSGATISITAYTITLPQGSTAT